MTDIHAAIGRVQLTKVDGWTAQRQRNAAILDAGLAAIDGVLTPKVAEGAVHVYHQYTVRFEAGERDRIVRLFKKNTGRIRRLLPYS